MKISTRAKENFQFLLHSDLDMIGNIITEDSNLTNSTNSVSALEAFYSIETYGKELSCYEPQLLSKVMRTKKSWDLQIKLWAEGLVDRTLFTSELKDYCKNLPEWILKGTFKQAEKLFLAQVGYIPTWVKNQKDFTEFTDDEIFREVINSYFKEVINS